MEINVIIDESFTDCPGPDWFQAELDVRAGFLRGEYLRDDSLEPVRSRAISKALIDDDVNFHADSLPKG